MAKRRRRDDDKKIRKSNRIKHRKSMRYDTSDDESLEGSTSRERRAPRSRTGRGKDLFVLIGVIIVLAIITSGYIFYTNYYDTYFGTENENDGSNNNIVPNPNNNVNGNDNTEYPVPSFQLSEDSNPVAIMEIRDYGVVVIELYRNSNAKMTVENFLDYARRGFYNGLIFHRVIDSFMIQGGGFETDMTQKSIPPDMGPIPLEIDSKLKHVDGAVAMARTSDPNSATSQFFIDDGPQPSLEPGGVDQYGYAVFGQVVAGLEIVREISAVPTRSEGAYDDVPVVDIIINSVYEYTGPR